MFPQAGMHRSGERRASASTAVGLGGVFLHLDARLNYYRIFNETIEDFEIGRVADRQREVFGATGVPLPV